MNLLHNTAVCTDKPVAELFLARGVGTDRVDTRIFVETHGLSVQDWYSAKALAAAVALLGGAVCWFGRCG